MRIFVAVTDSDWFNALKALNPDEVNFWQPKGDQKFSALSPGEIFLFKLHSPLNYIVGGGIFTRQVLLPLSLTWEAFQLKNGVPNKLEFERSIFKYRKSDRQFGHDPVIGSLILSMPFFWKREQWIPIPRDWSSNIVRGKTYTTDEPIGLALFRAVENNLRQLNLEVSVRDRFGVPTIVHPRLGQAGFRLSVTYAYHAKCAITGEKTLPVLEAAHIRPYSFEGPHLINNGILLRQDFHTLFDRGYITVTQDNYIEVSKMIKEDFGNGKEYYGYHGKPIMNTPDRWDERPNKIFLQWHNENIYLG